MKETRRVSYLSSLMPARIACNTNPVVQFRSDFRMESA